MVYCTLYMYKVSHVCDSGVVYSDEVPSADVTIPLWWGG